MAKWNYALAGALGLGFVISSGMAHAGGDRGNWSLMLSGPIYGASAVAGAFGNLYVAACNGDDGCASVPKSVYQYSSGTWTQLSPANVKVKSHHSITVDTSNGDLWFIGPNGEIRHRYPSGWGYAYETIAGCARDIAAYNGTVYVVGCTYTWDPTFGQPAEVYRKRPLDSSWTRIGASQNFVASNIVVNIYGTLFALGSTVSTVPTQKYPLYYNETNDLFYFAPNYGPNQLGCFDLVSNAGTINCVSRAQPDGSAGDGHLDIWSYIGDPLAGTGYWRDVIHGPGNAGSVVDYALVETALPAWEWNYALVGGTSYSGGVYRQTTQPTP